jgi:hypothetical protein
VARGKVDVAGQVLASGDAAAFEVPGPISLLAVQPSEILLFDLA